ncbi:hypothetical protein chiPu_0032984, partial [Chiloscyllium punctatum]|nr:hypothetical protein [Chiloscyllium punctatum]
MLTSGSATRHVLGRIGAGRRGGAGGRRWATRRSWA